MSAGCPSLPGGAHGCSVLPGQCRDAAGSALSWGAGQPAATSSACCQGTWCSLAAASSLSLQNIALCRRRKLKALLLWCHQVSEYCSVRVRCYCLHLTSCIGAITAVPLRRVAVPLKRLHLTSIGKTTFFSPTGSLVWTLEEQTSMSKAPCQHSGNFPQLGRALAQCGWIYAVAVRKPGSGKLQ